MSKIFLLLFPIVFLSVPVFSQSESPAATSEENSSIPTIKSSSPTVPLTSLGETPAESNFAVKSGGEELKILAEWAKILQSVIVSICAVVTTGLAVFGFSKWRRELKGKSEYELSKSILKAVYRVKRGVAIVRNRCTYGNEAPPQSEDDSGGRRYLDYEHYRHIYDNRWQHISEPMAALEDLLIDAKAEFGRSFDFLVIPLRQFLVSLNLSLENYLESKKNTGGQCDSEALRSDSDLIFDRPSRPAAVEFTKRLDEVVKNFDTEFEAKIRQFGPSRKR